MQRFLLLAAALGLSAPARCEQAVSSDGAYTVEAPVGWKPQTPKPGYLISLGLPDGKGGFTLSPAPADVTSEETARSGVQTLAGDLGRKYKTQFGNMETLDTPQPGRMVFVMGSMQGKQYVLGYYGVSGRWFRVDILAGEAAGAANYLLSSFRPAGGAGAGPKRRADRAAPTDGRFSVLLPKGWFGEPSSDDSELILKTPSGDELRMASEPSVDDDAKADSAVDRIGAATEKSQGLRFSNASRIVVEDIDLHYSLGHAQGEMLDSVLVGVFKSGTSYFRVTVTVKANRPLDLAQTALERFQLKGQETAAPASEGSAPPQQAAAPSGPSPTDLVAAKFKTAKSSGGGEGYAWKLMAGMAVVPILLVAGIAFFGKQKKVE